MIRSIAATAVVALFTLVNALIAAPASAQQPLPAPPIMLKMDVTSISPRLIDADSRSLSVEATLTNVSDRRISGLSARLQLGTPVTTEEQLSQAVAGDAPVDAQLTPFREVTSSLAPGASVRLSITTPITGGPDALLLAQPGVYPLLINVNGTPDYGNEARLAALNMLLPVLEPPGQKKSDAGGSPTPTSLLWPITYGSPRVISAPAGGRLVLPDERLAESLRAGGRLHSLVTAAETARTNKSLFDSMCFVVDPALIATASAMSRGYEVLDATGRRAGIGAADARTWLVELRDLVADRCVIALPYAGADVTALTADHPELARSAVSANHAVVSEVLKVQPVKEVFFSPGTLVDGALDALLAEGRKVIINDPRLLKTGGAEDPDASGAVTKPVNVLWRNGSTSDATAIPFDTVFNQALARKEANPEAGGNTALAAGEPSTAAQNGIATLAFRTRFAEQRPEGTLLMAPPQLFNADYDELVRMLNVLSAFDDARMVRPKPIGELFAEHPTGTARAASAVNSGLGPQLEGSVAGAADRITRALADLGKAMTEDATKQVEPEHLLLPVKHGLLRAASAYWRPQPELAERSAADAEEQLAEILDEVRVSNPRRTISMASGAAPIPVVITNHLPVEVAVRLTLSNTVGLRPDAVGDVRVPANSRRNIQIPATALRAGRFSVDVALSTPGGTDLGEVTRFELASTEYGSITVIVTATAAGALLLLSGRRIYRRVRNGRAERGEAA